MKLEVGQVFKEYDPRITIIITAIKDQMVCCDMIMDGDIYHHEILKSGVIGPVYNGLWRLATELERVLL